MQRIMAMVLKSLFVLCLLGCGGGNTADKAGKTKADTSVSAPGTDKIVGTWGFVKASNNREPEWGTTLKLSADGKIAMRGPGYANAGKYAVEQNKLNFTAGPLSESLAIVTLSDKELILEQSGFGNLVRIEYQKK